MLIIYLISVSETHSNFYVPNTVTTTGTVTLNLEVCIRLTGSFFKVHMAEKGDENSCVRDTVIKYLHFLAAHSVQKDSVI